MSEMATVATIPYVQLTDRAQQLWSDGDFARMGVAHVIVGERLAERIGIRPGESVLDVASGSGNTALAAARRGATVMATDFVDDLLSTAERRARAEGLTLTTQNADAQQLPFDDATFDVVLSTFGVMFAPDQQRAADELLRVCRPGGRIGLTNWTPTGLMGSSQAVTARHAPPPPIPGLRRPLEWGTEARVRELLGRGVAELHAERRTTDVCASSATDRVDLNRTYMGPTRAAFSQLDADGQARLAADLAADLERFNRATDGTLVAAAEYLEVIAIRQSVT